MNKTQERVTKVLTRMIEMAGEDEEYAGIFSDELDLMLNELLDADSFGTEGQSDPRGDMRDGKWDMGEVQGVDNQ